MGRSGYTDDMDDNWELIRWRGAVAAAIRGKRGQDFLRTMLTAMDTLPEKRLIADELENDDGVCAIASVGKLRAMDMSLLDPEDYDGIAASFGISQALVREIEYVNDECEYGGTTSPERRFEIVRKWVVSHIRNEQLVSGYGTHPTGTRSKR